jgi:hypothetical protein
MVTFGEYVAACGKVWSRGEVRMFCQWFGRQLCDGKAEMPTSHEAWQWEATAWQLYCETPADITVPA